MEELFLNGSLRVVVATSVCFIHYYTGKEPFSDLLLLDFSSWCQFTYGQPERQYYGTSG